MKMLFLLPPSEGKNKNNQVTKVYTQEQLHFQFKKPFELAKNATEKDLKCKGERYSEGIKLNQDIANPQIHPQTIPAIERYSGVMYKAIDYFGMTDVGKDFFQKNFLICSGMYGIVSPTDLIANYKLPIETKGLYQFWGDKIMQTLVEEKPDYIVNLLPIAYAKLIKNIKKYGMKTININFLKSDGKKMTHGVKKIKGERIKKICEQKITEHTMFGGEIREDGDIVTIDLVQDLS